VAPRPACVLPFFGLCELKFPAHGYAHANEKDCDTLPTSHFARNVMCLGEFFARKSLSAECEGRVG
jgi:hypothetical protein